MQLGRINLRSVGDSRISLGNDDFHRRGFPSTAIVLLKTGTYFERNKLGKVKGYLIRTFLHYLLSVAKCRGSWVVGRGSWVVGRGSWVWVVGVGVGKGRG